MKFSFAATKPLTSIKRFLAVYSDSRSRKRDRVELRQCGFKRGTATALFQSAANADATKPIAVWLRPNSFAMDGAAMEMPVRSM